MTRVRGACSQRQKKGCGGFGLGGGRRRRGERRVRGRWGICGREMGKLKSRVAKTLDTPRLVSFQVMFSTRTTRASKADKDVSNSSTFPKMHQLNVLDVMFSRHVAHSYSVKNNNGQNIFLKQFF